MTAGDTTWLNDIQWNNDGLVPAIAQDHATGKVLTLAWMNRDALERTVKEGYAVYWSRSRHNLWKKGEKSGHFQQVLEVRTDCDSDTILLVVRQKGDIACHTGRYSCFFMRLENGKWETVEPVVKEPSNIYGPA
jgi:phosphoribosyl-AMP cyclohydrolase